ncbi:hypothetical protein [Dongia sedimenti]|uniref:Uncharacterized protein n=1 Tax=Dongia sedimenti TaxID=3064282 RepID=A0ABU0YS52_9PROT|nr:hypothetical protein [Rhodospirillaceae bacterium R-7]
MSEPFPAASEPTEQGEQVLVPGVAPLTLQRRLAALFTAPLTSSKPQRPMNIGLFDEDARNQLDLF